MSGTTCGIPGCKTTSGYLPYLERHRALPHSTCSCGWVGPYFKMHAAAMTWRRPDRLIPHLEQPLSLFDHERTEPA